jgi:hypothetical protein
VTTEPDPAAPTGPEPGSERAADASSPSSSAPPPSSPSSAPLWSAPGGPSQANRGGIIVGSILIVLGLLFLAERLFDINLGEYGWPLFVILPGVLLFLASLAAPPRQGVGLGVAGAITTVVGLILAVQNATGLWATWAYVWPLVAPGGSGLGMALYGLLRGQPDFVSLGARQLGVGLGLFVAFGLFFEGVIGLSGDPFLVGSDYLPIVLIGIGVLFLLWSLLRGRRTA